VGGTCSTDEKKKNEYKYIFQNIKIKIRYKTITLSIFLWV
jgi:hypothetical protein